MSHSLLLGCIADDFTGATDLANNLVRSGMRVAQINGLPTQPLAFDSSARVDAVVIALKTRTVAPAQAVAQSLAALYWLKLQGVHQVYFKYCSTFDSTTEGNIGPVIEALMEEMALDFTVATPAFPDNGRTVFKGHLFVGDVLLSDSGMRHHPLTPMTDANLVRVLQAQCKKRRVGLIDHIAVAQGPAAIKARIAALKAEGVGIAVVDAVSNDDLMRLGQAVADLPLLTAGSGVAIGLPRNHGLATSNQASALPRSAGYRAIISGSCSEATNAQVLSFLAQGGLAFSVDPLRLAAGEAVEADALAWAAAHMASGPVLIYSTAAASGVKAVQGELGVAHAGELVERCLAAIAKRLVTNGVRQLVVAGGETSGACVQALGIKQMRIGPQIDPGVPWCHAHCELAGVAGLHIALKSGNFGAEDFFFKAFRLLE